MRKALIAAAAIAIATATAWVTPATAAPLMPSPIIGANSPAAIKDSYIVVLKDTEKAVKQRADALAKKHGARLGHVYTKALKGFSVKLGAEKAARLAREPGVAYVEQDQTMRLVDHQPPQSWGLDRVDQRNLPLDNEYNFPGRAENVTAYIIDTGIRISHNDFQGRARHGRDLFDNDNDASDCNGHGSHVAGTVGGREFGVAKGVDLVAVKVFGCSGSTSTSIVIAGVDWVTDNAVRPAVANMSLGGPANTSLDNAVRRSINAGITYALAAGNESTDACTRSPARTAEAITVGATDRNDNRASFSNFGPCLDLFAPGVGITSAWWNSDTATNTISGTSMASPHAAGGAALVLGENPSATPAQVSDAMVSAATEGVVNNPGPGSPNLLMFVGPGEPEPPGEVIFEDDLETEQGWAANPGGGDTATTGQFERGNPDATSYLGTTTQPGTTPSGSNALVTGASSGGSVGANDIDNGVTSIQSAPITLPSGGSLELSFSWFLGHLSNSSNADYIRVRVVGSSTTTVLDQRGAPSNRSASWATESEDISAHAGQTVRILIDAADASGASLVEAGVDDLRITRTE